VSLIFSSIREDIAVKTARIVEWTQDPSIPEDQSSKILFWFDINSYNGIDIEEVFNTKRMLYIKSLITIPPGTAEITFDSGYSRSYASRTVYYTIQDCIFQYNFEPGKKYFVSIGRELKSKGGLFKDAHYTYYALIYDYFPTVSKGRITKREYKKLNKSLTPTSLLASLPIFETDIVEKE
jgi:hypothetical protein